MYRFFLHSIMLLPILAATVLTYSRDPLKALAPEKIMSWTEIVAAYPALNQVAAASTETSTDVVAAN